MLVRAIEIDDLHGAELSREPLDVNEKICRPRPVEETLTRQEKSGRSDQTELPLGEEAAQQRGSLAGDPKIAFRRRLCTKTTWYCGGKVRMSTWTPAFLLLSIVPGRFVMHRRRRAF
jgi:hypothetical protein